MGKYDLGIDLGGTKIMGITVDSDYKILSSTKVKTKHLLGPDGICRQMKEVADEVLEGASLTWDDIDEVGVAVPTSIDPKTGEGLHAPNLGWRNQPIRKTLEKVFKRKVYLENDVNCGTLAEFKCGAARKYRNVVGFFVGTGLGGGIIIDGRLVRGVRGAAGELGHEIVRYKGRKCGCGNRGCIEAYCSKTAFGKQFHKHINHYNEKSILSKLCDGDFTRLKSKTLHKAFKAKDDLAISVVRKGFEMLGVASANLVTILAPECIVYGGGVVEELREEVMPMIRESFEESLFALSPGDVKLVLSQLGDDAVPLGAAILAREKGNV